MSTFTHVEQALPPGHVTMPPSAWGTKWEKRPREEVCLGLRFVPELDLEDARLEAFKRAERLFPKFRESEVDRDLFVASFNDTLMRWVIAHGTCDPNDANAHWEGWADAPEDIAVHLALTDTGAQRIFDKWEQMRIAADIALPTATDADIALLPELARRLPTLSAASRTREQRCRRLLRFVLEELESIQPTEATSTDVEQGAVALTTNE